MNSAFSRVALLGPGLLGGSLAMALRARMPETHLRVWGRRSEAVEAVRTRGLADVATTRLEPVVAGADLVVLCVPVEAMEPLVRELLSWLAPGAIVTDVGSVKAEVVDALAPLLGGQGRFVGSHPMAGSEQAGIEAARADLFSGSVCILTPDARAEPAAVDAVESFWTAVGCDVRRLSPKEHDEAIALVSHLPHLLAAALTAFVADRSPAALEFCGPGFRDTTRVASGPADMWSGIFRANRAAVRSSLEALIEKLSEIATLLAQSDDVGIKHMLSEAKATRDRLKKNG